MKSSRAFTLIELLIVIAILGILMALLFPAVSGAIDAARKAQAKNDVVQIATAITAYETEYGRLPLPESTSVNTALLAVLTGADTNNNPRQIVFLEVQPAKRGKSGTNGSGFVDPWALLSGGNPSATYQVRMDAGSDPTPYNNKIDVAIGKAPGPTAPAGQVMKKVVVWNEPPGTSTEQKKRSVASWE
jgi:prepilin-type N-terminal cleavage/methylation domain-containing protein